MRTLAVILMASLALAHASTAAPPKAKPHSPSSNPRCATLRQAIEDSVKQMGAIEADGAADNSAPRATMRAGQISNQQAEIQNNILLMRSNSCPAYEGSLSSTTYLLPALDCATSMLQDSTKRILAQPAAGSAQDSDTSKVCDRASWKPGKAG